MKKHYKLISLVTAGVMAVLGLGISRAMSVSAAGVGLTVSPMNQKVIVAPGDSSSVSFKISNPSASTETVKYELSVEPFYMSEANEVVYQEEGNYSEIANWISFDTPTSGSIEPNGVEEVTFTIDAPANAPAGGQYFSVMVTKVDDDTDDENGDVATNERQTTIKETYVMAHLVYAEITGATVRQGTITDTTLPSFIMSGNITGSATVKNTGNVHGEATYTMQIFPLFSGEEVYTNEENPETAMILPNREVYHETSWDDTPGVGIYNVVYTVKFGDAMEQISKMVIVCPIWLLFLIIFVVIALFMWIAMRIRARSRKSHRATE